MVFRTTGNIEKEKGQSYYWGLDKRNSSKKRGYIAIALDVDLTSDPIVFLRSDDENLRDGGYIMEVAVKSERKVCFEILEEVSIEELLTHPDQLIRDFANKRLQCTQS